MQGFCSDLRAGLLQHVVACNLRIQSRRRQFERPAFVAAALDWLRSSGRTAQLSDKDGISVLIKTSLLNDLYEESFK